MCIENIRKFVNSQTVLNLVHVLTAFLAVFGMLWAIYLNHRDQKIFGFENRVIPKVELTEDFKIQITNNGKSPVRELRGYFVIFHEDGGVVVDKTEGKLFPDILESGESSQFTTQFKLDNMKSQNGHVFIIIGLRSPDFVFQKDKNYFKITYITLTDKRRFQTSRRLRALGKEHKALVHKEIDEIERTLPNDKVFFDEG